MKRPSIVFLLLLAIALGLSAGPHPCHAAAGPAPEQQKTETMGHASCHPVKSPVRAPARPNGHDCCDPVKGGHVLCDQACQATAELGAAPTVPAAHSFQELPAAGQDRPASLFVLSIDHVPLA